jgi:release factor glutamine methyltransferase
MNVAQALRAATRRLQPVADTGALDASRLLEHVTGRDRAGLLMASDVPLDPLTAEAFETLVVRRERGEPVAYLVGSAGFYGRTFLVDERVLVPRPESEHIVEAVMDDLRARRKTNGIVVDVGTGSGALGITLACELPGLAVYAADISPEALSVARRNAALNGVFQRCTFLAGDLLAPLVRFGERVDAVVANLPYIPAGEVPLAPSPASYEPRVALDGGPDGLDLYRRLLAQLHTVTADDAAIFLEAAPGTIEPLGALVEQMFPTAFIEIGEDYAGLERFLTFCRAAGG